MAIETYKMLFVPLWTKGGLFTSNDIHNFFNNVLRLLTKIKVCSDVYFGTEYETNPSN